MPIIHPYPLSVTQMQTGKNNASTQGQWKLRLRSVQEFPTLRMGKQTDEIQAKQSHCRVPKRERVVPVRKPEVDVQGHRKEAQVQERASERESNVAEGEK